MCKGSHKVKARVAGVQQAGLEGGGRRPGGEISRGANPGRPLGGGGHVGSGEVAAVGGPRNVEAQKGNEVWKWRGERVGDASPEDGLSSKDVGAQESVETCPSSELGAFSS